MRWGLSVLVLNLTLYAGIQPTNCWSAFDHFVGLALKGLILILYYENKTCFTCYD